jgi:3-methyladenine DNA glycosylase/8-oxoguanine DNA glycosylase
LDADLAAFESKWGADPLLALALERWRGMRVSAGGSLYEMLVIYVLLQNATVRRTVQMMQALFERFGTLLRFDGHELYAFWPPEALAAVSEGDLRVLKVGYRARFLHRLSRDFASGAVDEAALRGLDKEEARRALLKLYGIGPASVGYLLFEVLHHYDALDYVSPWEQRIYSRLFFDEEVVPAERILGEAKRRWGPWRMLAAHHLFEDLFWRRKNEPIEWLEKLIRL